MKRLQNILLLSLTMGCCLLGLIGCASNPNHTHRADLLDDKVTAQRVEAAFKDAGADFKNVTVKVNGGEVTLQGTVASPEIRSRAEELVQGTDRVTNVKNELQISR